MEAAPKLVMCDVEKQEAELKQKCDKQLQNVTDPVEKFRLKLLSRGTATIKGLGRYIIGCTLYLPGSIVKYTNGALILV